MDSSTTGIILQIILIIILILINAFFSSTEMAIVSINKNKLKVLVEEGNLKAKKLEKLLDDPSNLLSTIQIGITLAGFLASASAAVGISEVFAKFLNVLNIPYYNQLSVIIVTLMLSYLTLVFGELLPKRLAMINPEKIAFRNVGTIIGIYILFIPFITILALSTDLILKIMGLSNSANSEIISREELRLMITDTDMKKAEIEMIEKIIDFDDKVAREVMIPRTSMFAIDVEMNIDELLNTEEIIRYSRIPVYSEDLDNIIGILHTKSLLKTAYSIGFSSINIKSILQKALFVPETKKIQSLFIEMKNLKKHIAILVDEYGGVSGMVTLEDLLEEIVGNINDEYDGDNEDIQKISKNKYLVNASVSLNDLNDKLKTNFESIHYDSLNGILIEKLGYIPMNDNKIKDIKIDGVNIKVLKVSNRKIDKVIIELENKEKNNV